MRAAVCLLPLLPTALWAQDAPRVVTDIAPVHSIVAAVMDGVGAPELILPPGASPHGYAMLPSEARALNEAEVVIWVGPTLTPWLDDSVDALAGSAHVLTLLDVPGISQLVPREGAAFEGGHDGHDHGDHDDHDNAEAGHKDDDHADHDHADHKDEDHGDHDHDHGHKEDDHAGHDHGHEDAAHKDDDHDGHGHEDAAHSGKDDHDHGHAHAQGVDPHAWLDPTNAVIWAAANADVYTANAATFAETMESVVSDVEAVLAPVKGRPFVVFHDAYHYFEHHFEFEAVGAISASDAAAASAARVADVRDRVAELGAVCALTEPQYNPGIADAIGAAKLGEIDPLGAALQPGPALYPALLTNMAKSLSDCLQ